MPDGICPFAEWIPGVDSFSPGNGGRVGFCDHTAGGFLSTMRRASFWNGAGVSTHFAIGREGAIVQLVNIFDSAWAQGRLGPQVTWLAYGTMRMQNPNLYLISTEHEDAVSVNGVTRFIAGSEWTPEQYEADLAVKRWCVEEVRRVTGEDLLRFGIDSLAGHHMFDSVNRAECPGRFWRNEYRLRLFDDLTTEDPMDADKEIELTLLRQKQRLDRALAMGKLLCVPGPTPDTVEIRQVVNNEGLSFNPPLVVPVE